MYDPYYDKSGRRRRHAPPLRRKLKNGKYPAVVITEADIVSFKVRNDHGPLPIHYIYPFIKTLRRDYTFNQKREGKLRNELFKEIDQKGKSVQGHYYKQPDEQKRADGAERRALMRENDILAEIVLEREGTRVHKRGDHYLHRMMNSCVTTSKRIRADELGLKDAQLNDILAKKGCPEKTRASDSPLRIALRDCDLSVPIPPNHLDMVITPDHLCGTGYPSTVQGKKDGWRFLAWEQDRGNESHEAYIDYKFIVYMYVLEHRLYEQLWGIPNLYVTFITTKPGRLPNLMKRWERITKSKPHLRQYMLFKCKPEFAGPWETPPVMRDILDDPFERVDLPPFSLVNPEAH